jgi:hypothetical protein
MLVSWDDEDAQVMILALAQLALDRPGWDRMIRLMVQQFKAEEMFERFKELNADRFKLLPLLDGSPRR